MAEKKGIDFSKTTKNLLLGNQIYYHEDAKRKGKAKEAEQRNAYEEAVEKQSLPEAAKYMTNEDLEKGLHGEPSEINKVHKKFWDEANRIAENKIHEDALNENEVHKKAKDA